MHFFRKISVLFILSVLLAACKPGPVYIGGPPPVAVKDTHGNVQYVSYRVNKKRTVMVPASKGSDLMANKIRAAYAQDPLLKPYNIDVAAHRGEVTLTGNVPNDNVKSYAIKIARYTKGVLMVRDRLVVTH